MKLKAALAPILLTLLGSPGLFSANITWDGNGTVNASGVWSLGANWSTNTNPGSADTAILPDVTTGTRVVTFDAAATSPVLELQMEQSTAGAINQLDFVRDATITNAITLGSSAGTEEIRLSPSTTAGRNLIAPGGITLNTGGLLTMGANFEGTTQRTSTVTGNLSIAGGTLFVSPSGLASSANSRTVTGTLTMTSGTLSIDSATGAQSRLQAAGFTITGGAVNRGTGTSSQSQLVTNGSSNTLSPTTFDKVISVSLLTGNQAITIGTPIGELISRNTGAASTTTTKTVTMSGTGSTGKLSFGVASANSVSNVVLGSTLAVTNDPVNGSMPTGTFGSTGNTVNYGIDTAGYTLDLTAARAGGGSIIWTPNVQGGGTNWNLTNSGTALQGGIKVGNINFSAATQVNVGAGATVEITGGNSTAINAGGGGTWNAASLLNYSGAAAGSTPATLTSNRTIGDLLISGNGALQLLSGSAANAYQNDVTIRQGTLIVGANSLLGGAAASPVKLGDGTSSTNSRIVLQFGNGITIDRPIDVSAPLGPAADANSQRARILLSGTAATGTVSGDVTYGLAGSATAQRLEISAVSSTSVLTISGRIKPPASQTSANGLLINGGNSGTGTVKFTNTANDFTGGMSVVNGTFLLAGNVPSSGSSLIGTNGTVTIADGATPEAATISLLMDGAHTFARNVSLANNTNSGGTQYTAEIGMAAGTSGTSTWSGNVVSGSDTRNKTLRLTAPDGASAVFSGSIGANAGTGMVALDKAGAGTVELTGANTYDGNTTISAGTLLVNNTSGSATGSGTVTVNTTTTLGGSGTISGAVTVNGTLAPGTSPGILSTGDLDFASSGVLLAEMARGLGLSPSAGTDYDQVDVSGGINLLNNPTLSLAALGSGGWVEGHLFFLLNNDSNDPITGTFAGIANQGVFTFDGAQFKASYFADSTSNSFTGGNDFAIQVVPEPGSLAIACLTVSLGLLRRRRIPG